MRVKTALQESQESVARAPAPPAFGADQPQNVAPLLHLQRTHGNRFVQRLVQRTVVQRQCGCGGSLGHIGECADCGDQQPALQRTPISQVEPLAVPPIVSEVLRTPGQPLDVAIRAFMEPRFRHDFSQVRIHTDARAAESARAINALAYTVGRDVVFGVGQYTPETITGRQLLAHELTHVVQQQDTQSTNAMAASLTLGELGDIYEREADQVAAAVTAASAGAGARAPATEPPPIPSVQRQAAGWSIIRRWLSCGTAEQCPSRDAGERSRAHVAQLRVGTLLATPTDVIVQPFDIGVSDASSLNHDPGWAPFWGSLVTQNHRWEILGFSDCEGRVELNTSLRWMRAMHVNNLLPALARAKIDRFVAAPLSDCVAANDTEEGRALNRSVVLHQTVSAFDFPEERITALSCPPRSSAGVTTLSDYISLLMCAERQTGFGPRDMLAMLRQLYYGKPWSAVSTTSKWDNVIPCSPNLGNPEARLGTNLFQALGNSAEVAGVDVGHVFTGLEAMTCPSASVNFFGGLGAVSMPNEEFATWGGDLGAAAAAFVACPQLGPTAAANEDCGHMAGSQPLAFYLGVHAPAQDLEGDIDSFVMRAQLLGIPCIGSVQQRFTPTRPMSEVFFDYYQEPSSALGAAHTNRYLCFLQVLGATVSGRSITNLPALSDPIAARIASFGEAFFTKIKGGTVVDTPDIGDRLRIRIAAEAARDWFFAWVTSRLP